MVTSPLLAMGITPIKNGKISLFWVEYEFAIAVKYHPCYPKEHYNSSPSPKLY